MKKTVMESIVTQERRPVNGKSAKRLHKTKNQFQVFVVSSVGQQRREMHFLQETRGQHPRFHRK
jgi:hypothetical protein